MSANLVEILGLSLDGRQEKPCFDDENQRNWGYLLLLGFC
jgi:hypothetical protein